MSHSIGWSTDDLTPLADCPTLERLRLPAQCQDIEFLRRFPHLLRLSYEDLTWDKTQTPAEFWKEYDARKRMENGK